MYKTVEVLAQDVFKMLSIAGGVGTQRYSEQQTYLLLEQCFDVLYIRQWWPDLMQWFSPLTLDGTTGLVIEDISAIKRFEDIRAVYVPNSDRPLPILPSSINPYNILDAQVLFIDSNATNDKVFKVFSANATGTVAVHARLHPGTFVPSTQIKFDSLALELGVAWFMSEDDATNPGQANKFQVMFENRIKDLEAELSSKPISLDHSTVNYPNGWWVR